jgi:hypothetical protein
MASQRPDEEQAEQGFSISDKRLFTKEGQRRASADQAEASPMSAPSQASAPPPKQEAPRVEEPRRTPPVAEEMPPRDMPPVDFPTFVAMLANNVMMFLGQIPDPATQQRHRDLQQAKHTIDILIMLQEKTQGNLTSEEQQFMQELLPQLQMAYVSASKQVG